MRCLYCNKKLSLLKLAKGDSFCSAEHFDAHQLQLSKNAFERLMSLPEEDAPKAPLVVKPAVEEEVAPLARLTAFSAPPPEKVPALKLPAAPIKPPPYAPFATSLLPPYSPNSPSRIANRANEPVQPARELAFPVHDVEATVCILNLYLRLGLAGTEPLNWTPARPSLEMLVPEGFHGEIARPSRKLSIESLQLENLAPGEPAQPIEAAAPADLSHSSESFAVAEATPSTMPVLPVEPESLLQPIEAPELVSLQIEILAPGEPAQPIEAAAPADLGHSSESFAVAEATPSTMPVLPVEPESLLQPIEAPELVQASEPVQAVEPIQALDPIRAPEPIQIDPRLQFLMAPSFRERAGTLIVLNGAASSVPDGAILAPILDTGKLPRLDSSGGIAQSTRFVSPADLLAKNSNSSWVRSAPELPMPTDFVHPEAKRNIDIKGWTTTSRTTGIARPALESSREPVCPLDYDLPAPDSLVVRPDARRLKVVHPRQLLHGESRLETGTLFLGVLETSPVGQEMPFVHPPASATPFGLSLLQAPASAWQPFSSAAWKDRTDPLPLPASTADWSAAPMPPFDALPYALGCTRVSGIETAEVAAPWLAHTPYCQVALPEIDCPSAPVLAERGSIFTGSTILPPIAKVPDRSLEIDGGAPSLTWTPRVAATPAPAVVKFLPIRTGALLPSVKSWPRLGSVSR